MSGGDKWYGLTSGLEECKRRNKETPATVQMREHGPQTREQWDGKKCHLWIVRWKGESGGFPTVLDTGEKSEG